ncbi:uncharacterized protein LOC119731591 [Patiria miniata]|uniref:Uncharacterized protein n=1 Tax=Patiria miniata TaxID=46514 RepID=A0A914AAB8_PATMI|nr:uncharacterized protein LOC119731591 [Patiria miniata]
MNSSDPLVRDRGIVTNRDKETSLRLHRKNSMQQDHLDKELKRLDKEQQKCIRRTHLEKCAISRDQKCLVSDLGKFTISADDAPSDDEGVADQTSSEEPPKSPPATRRKEAVPEAVRAKQKVRTRRVSLPDELPDHPSVSMATKKDKQERFIDQRMSREISRLKKASIRADSESKESDDRKGKPRIPTNAWYHDNQNAKARERSSSVFDRLSEGSKITSMSSQQFLQKVRKQRSHTISTSSPTRTRRAERR